MIVILAILCGLTLNAAYPMNGDFIAFIDADDVWRPRKLEEQIAILNAHPDVGMGLLFDPRGGSAQVVRYLVPALEAAGWPVKLKG